MHFTDQFQHTIPWWQDLTPAARASLELPSEYIFPSHTVDVIVIGGGVAGLSTAFSACQEGTEVLLLEAQPLLGYGATGRNAGILSSGINMNITDLPPDSSEAAFWPETDAILHSLIEEAQQPNSLLQARLTGAVSLATSRNAARKQEKEARVRQALGLRAEQWTTAQVAELTRGRLHTAEVKGVLWIPDEGRIQPLSLLAHLAHKARIAGVTMIGNAYVHTYEEIQHRGKTPYWQLTLADGQTISARGLIRTVGPTAQPTARIYALAFEADLPDTFPLFWDASPYTYADFRPGNGRLGISGGRYGKVHATPKQDAAYHERLADAARTWLPELAGEEPAYAWAVDLAVTPDMIPHIYEVGERGIGLGVKGLGSLGVLPGILLGRRAGKRIAEKVR